MFDLGHKVNDALYLQIKYSREFNLLDEEPLHRKGAR